MQPADASSISGVVLSAKESAEQTWSVRTLQRNVSSQYYYRLLKSQAKDAVETEMQSLTASGQRDKLEFIKNPVIAEFLGLPCVLPAQLR